MNLTIGTEAPRTVLPKAVADMDFFRLWLCLAWEKNDMRTPSMSSTTWLPFCVSGTRASQCCCGLRLFSFFMPASCQEGVYNGGLTGGFGPEVFSVSGNLNNLFDLF
jgi:hypothetical protein